jgi:uncharacterized glyoxalase superfamily protein PhnB
MIIPTLRYEDAKAAIDFLVNAFGFERHHITENDDGTIAHAELRHGSGVVMVSTARGDDDRFATGRAVTYVVTDDPDGVHDRANAAGAPIVQELTDQDYGSREFAAEDSEGNVWSFGTYDPFAS